MRKSLSAPPRRAVITGASSGIGAAFAYHLARTSSVLLVARSKDRLEALAGDLKKCGNDEHNAEICIADLATQDGIDRTIAAARSFNAEMLINNAGMGTFAPLMDTNLTALTETVRLNAEAPLILSRALIPDLIARARQSNSRAKLINVSSSVAFAPVPGLATYAATKAFLQSLTESLAVEMRNEPIDILSLCPGATRSEFAARAGFAGGQLPGAVDPGKVVSAAFEALGRRTTLLTGPERVPLAPVVFGRTGVSGAIGMVVNRLRRI